VSAHRNSPKKGHVVIAEPLGVSSCYFAISLADRSESAHIVSVPFAQLDETIVGAPVTNRLS
jgi:hypothetical protein